MVVILLAFSSILIYTVESKIRQGLRDRIVITQNEDDPIKEMSDKIEMLIYIVDGILLVGIGFSSYFLAGKTLKPIRKVLEAQKKFSADASHDLRTPLAIVTTESEVILADTEASKDDLRKTIGSNLEEVRKMSKLVHDLLLLSRGDNHAPAYALVRVDAHNFLEKIVEKMRAQAQQKGLTMHLSRYKKICIAIDPNTFDRAISNIVQNAIKYTHTGTITIDITEDVRKAYITIKDTGVGIDQKDLPHIFDRFYKAEHSRNDISSSGLGLSIAKLIIEEYDGAIEVKSNVGKGTEVRITVPKTS
jgi:signal transduction histidine kinase